MNAIIADTRARDITWVHVPAFMQLTLGLRNIQVLSKPGCAVGLIHRLHMGMTVICSLKEGVIQDTSENCKAK